MLKAKNFSSLAIIGFLFLSIAGMAEQRQGKQAEKAPAQSHQEAVTGEKFLDASRPVDTSQVLRGIITVKAESGKEWRYFQVGDTNYKITQCSDTCIEELFKCKGGELCNIKADISKKDGVPEIIARTIKVLPKNLEDLSFDKNFSFAEVEPGEFTMGSPSTEKGRDEDEVAHRVAITKGFEIGKTEVTQGIWKKVMGSLPKGISKQDKSLPITNVSWNEIQDFMIKLNGVRKGDGYAYRLPTEAEWEYAARGAQKASPEARQNAYSFGNTDTGIDDYARSYNNSKDGAQQVGSRKANQLGLSDMHGNVWEWTMDKYSSDASKVPVDPKYGHQVNLTEGSYRVFRGGSWFSIPQDLRSANRYNNTPGNSNDLIGFRLVRTPE